MTTSTPARVTARRSRAGRVSPGPVPHGPSDKPRRGPLTWMRGGGLSALLFLLPMFVVFTVFSWIPIGQTVVMSLQETNLVTMPVFVGLDNFTTVLNDPLLGKAVRNTLWFAFLALVIGYPVPLVVAVLMNEVRTMRGLYSALAYLPVVVPPVVAVLLWKFFYDAGPHGLCNTVLGWFGAGPVSWLQDANTAMVSLVVEATWAAAGGTVIIYLAALTRVPPELYEAADLDGASLWRKVWHVTLPQLRGVLLITFILQIVGTAQVFLEPFLFTGGGPANSTTTILLLIYNYAFATSLGGDYGAATALSLMLAAVLAILSALYFRLTRSWST